MNLVSNGETTAVREHRERKQREKADLVLGPAYGRRVSVRAVAGAHFL